MARCDYNDYQAYEARGGWSYLFTAQELSEYEQHEAEAAAENAWLVAAESPTNDDLAFEQWERDRGCYLDPQSGYDV